MDTVIQFTPSQLLVYAGAIITISTAIGVFINKRNLNVIGCSKHKIHENKPTTDT